MIYIFVAAFVVALDLFTKYLAAQYLKEMQSIPLISGVFHLTYVENFGIAFGMLQNQKLIFLTLSVIVIAALLFYYKKSEVKTVWLNLGTALIIGGSIGNLFDRFFRGYVVDFIHMAFINFPVFNIADISICIGAVLIVIHVLFCDGSKK